jgi:tRNA(His) guanylyltransferase
MKNDDLGDRMKFFERQEVGRVFVPTLPVCVRIDGKNFSKWTKGLKRPYDPRLVKLMVDTTKYLVEETNAVVGYTQSDEISLILYSEDIKSQVFFNGKVQKIVSVIASMTTGYFNSRIPELIPERVGRTALFDARAWVTPSLEEAVNVLVWREIDATRNSISMAAHNYFSHKRLQGKSCSDMQDMLMTEKDVNWNDYPSFFKRGTYVRRQKIVRKFTAEEIDNLPEQHDARKNPDLEIERTEVKILNMPPIRKIDNRKEVIFEGQEAILK